MAGKLWKITELTWVISSWRLVEKVHNSAFHILFSIYNWIGEHEITKLPQKKLCSSFELRKMTQKQAQKDMSEKEWQTKKWTIWYFQQCACANAIYFAPVVTTS